MTRRKKALVPPPKVGDIKLYPDSDLIGQPVACAVTRVYLRRRSANGQKYLGAYYDSGLIKGFVQEIHYNQLKMNDNVIIIDGDEGSGKSSFAVRLAYLLNPDGFNASYICYTMDELRECISRCKGGETILMDESGNIVLNRDFAKKDNKDFVKLIQAIRVMRLNFLMVIPHMESLDLYIKEYRVKYWFHMITRYHGKERGFYRLWRPDSNREFSKGRYFEEIGCGNFKPLSEYPEMDQLVKDYETLKTRFVASMVTNDSGKSETLVKWEEKYGHAIYVLYNALLKMEMNDPYGYLQEEFGAKYYSLAKVMSHGKRKWGNIDFKVKGNIVGVKYKSETSLGRPNGSRNLGVCKIDQLSPRQRALHLTEEEWETWCAEHPEDLELERPKYSRDRTGKHFTIKRKKEEKVPEEETIEEYEEECGEDED